MENNDLTGAASLANLDLNEMPTFNYRGKDTFKESLSTGPRSNVDNAFTEIKRDPYGNKNKYPYLTSRFLINPKIKDPIVRDERSGDMSMTDEERELQASRARRGISGPKDILEDYELSAKLSSEIGDNLQEAQNNGLESEMSKAIFDAQKQSRENELLTKIIRKPKKGEKYGDKFTGDYVDNVAFKNASMIDNFNTSRLDAVAAQNLVDSNRQVKTNMNRFMANRKPFTMKRIFDTRSGN
jgi:hypothetical protein|tara:strand:+ start:1661 stop:2383 length:723 start_codon:yes stop_codon:yes gene_type:complete